MLQSDHLANPPLSLNCPRGLWMPPHWKVSFRFFWCRSFNRPIQLIKRTIKVDDRDSVVVIILKKFHNDKHLKEWQVKKFYLGREEEYILDRIFKAAPKYSKILWFINIFTTLSTRGQIFKNASNHSWNKLENQRAFYNMRFSITFFDICSSGLLVSLVLPYL